MPIYRVQAPDGTVLRIEGPDNAAQADLLKAAQDHYAAQESQSLDPSRGGGELRPFGISTGIQTPESVDRFLSGAGSGLMDLVQGAKQRMGMANEADTVAKRSADAPLLNTSGGRFGNFVGQTAPALATMPIPGANTLTGAALSGAALGALQPTAPGENVGGNMALGAAGGAAGQGAANLIGRAIAPVRGALNPEEQRLAQVMTDSGVPLDLAQKTGSKPLRIINSVLDNFPITSGVEEAKRATQNSAFTRAAMANAGESADNIAPETLQAGFDRLGKNFQDIYSRNTVKVDTPLLQDVFKAVGDSDSAPQIVAKANKILSFKEIPGEKYQDIRTQLRTLQQSADPEVAKNARSMKFALDDAAVRSVSPDDAALLQQTRQEYANLKPIEKAAKATTAVGGELPPLQFRSAVAQDPGYARGMGDQNDLARAGAMFLNNPVRDSGTAQRMMYQGLLTGGLGMGSGASEYLSSGDPVKALEATGTGLGAGLLGPYMIQKGLNSKLLGSYLAASPDRVMLAEEMKRLLSAPLLGAGTVAMRPK